MSAEKPDEEKNLDDEEALEEMLELEGLRWKAPSAVN
jgi:hypothetical protein